jgi:hypothetical protein
MAENLDSIERSDVHHEESDVDVGRIVKFGVALVVAAAVIHAAVAALFWYFDERLAEAATASPIAAGAARIPPEPRLQVDPRGELREYRAREDEVLSGYTWVDRDAGVVRIPVDEAMRLLVERGLPARPAGEAGAP